MRPMSISAKLPAIACHRNQRQAAPTTTVRTRSAESGRAWVNASTLTCKPSRMARPPARKIIQTWAKVAVSAVQSME